MKEIIMEQQKKSLNKEKTNYMEHIVYFYSGTGNSLAVAKELEKTGAELHSIACEYQKMLTEQRESIPCEARKIGFVIPTYYLGLPRIVHDFLKVLELKNTDYIYVIATMGWNIRGGIVRQIKEYLKNKNCKLAMGCYIQMPMNDCTLVSVDEPERQKVLLKKSKKAILQAVELVQKEKRHFDIEPMGFMVEKRNASFCKNVKTEDNKFSVTDECTGCGVCSRMCSCENIKIIDKKTQWQRDCQMCLACFHNCPKKAILYNGKGKEIPHYHHPDYSLAEKEKYSKL